MSSDVTEPLPLSLLSDRGQNAAILDFEMMKFKTEDKDKLLSKLNTVIPKDYENMAAFTNRP